MLPTEYARKPLEELKRIGDLFGEDRTAAGGDKL